MERNLSLKKEGHKGTFDSEVEQADKVIELDSAFSPTPQFRIERGWYELKLSGKLPERRSQHSGCEFGGR